MHNNESSQVGGHSKSFVTISSSLVNQYGAVPSSVAQLSKDNFP